MRIRILELGHAASAVLSLCAAPIPSAEANHVEKSESGRCSFEARLIVDILLLTHPYIARAPVSWHRTDSTCDRYLVSTYSTCAQHYGDMSRKEQNASAVDCKCSQLWLECLRAQQSRR